MATTPGQAALIFRIIVDGWLDQGPDLSFLSAFPHEKEFTYPPLTFFRPVGKMERLIYNGTEFRNSYHLGCKALVSDLSAR